MKLFSGKSKSHNDEPSNPLEQKVIDTQEPNYEGDVRGTKYSVDENHTTDKSGTRSVVKNERNPDYWLPAEDIDIYAVDTRIWDRIGELGGDGSGGGPHTHDGLYAGLNHQHDYTGDFAEKGHTHPPQDLTHNHDAEYAGKTHTHPAPTGFWKSWTGSQAEYDALGTYDDETLYVVV
jgi:hypothetical protein